MRVLPEAVVTFRRLDGFSIVSSFGLVSGEAVAPRNFLRATARSLGALIGIAPAEVLTDAERVRSQSLAAMTRQAESLGANAIVSLRFWAREQSDGSTRVVAEGEALLLDPVPGRAS